MMIARTAKALAPAPLKRWLKARLGRVDLRNDVGAAAIGPAPGPVAEAFAAAAKIRGFFTLDDAGLFLLALRLQSQAGVVGDLFEIGAYHGRSAAMMSLGLAPGERLHLCDSFGRPGGGAYAAAPSPAALRRNVAAANPSLAPERLVIHDGFSDQIRLAPAQRFRFIHIDGGHDAETCAHDLALAERHLAPGGLIVVDDYAHPDHPGVRLATDAFLAARPHVAPLLDVNRHGERGRKLFLAPAAPAPTPARR